MSLHTSFLTHQKLLRYLNLLYKVSYQHREKRELLSKHWDFLEKLKITVVKMFFYSCNSISGSCKLPRRINIFLDVISFVHKNVFS